MTGVQTCALPISTVDEIAKELELPKEDIVTALDAIAEYPGFLPLLLFRGGVPRFSSFPTVVGEHPIALAMALFV